MKTHALGIGDLKAQVDDLQTRYGTLEQDALFTAWFFRAYITPEEDAAVAATAGGAGDKGIDGILIDEKARRIFLVQTKYRKKLSQTTEKRADLIEFAELATCLVKSTDKEFQEFLVNLEARSRDLFRDSRRRLKKGDFKLMLYFVTTGKCGPAAVRDAAAIARKAEAGLEVQDGKRLLVVLRDYLDGAAPPIPTLDLPLEAGTGVRVNGVLQRYDATNKLESWVISVQGDAIAEIFRENGVRLFARNVRGFLGESTDVNKGMARTLRDEPGHFFYYNNGITIVCDRAEKISHKGRDLLRISNPQVINGQQTSRVLAEHEAASASASVLVKVIQVPREGEAGGSFDGLVSRIVQTTNWQNAIRASDLMSNDRTQIDLERELRKLDYLYLRKRQAKGEVRRLFGRRGLHVVSKEDLAQAVAGCELDPVVARSGKDKLFAEDQYERVFPHSDPSFFLSRYWLLRNVTYGARGIPRRGYTKWVVLGAAWRRLSPLLRAARPALRSREGCERDETSLGKPLATVIDLLFSAALRYYRANRGVGEAQLDVSLFFRSKRGRAQEFEEWLARREKAAVKKINSHLEQVRVALSESAEG